MTSFAPDSTWCVRSSSRLPIAGIVGVDHRTDAVFQLRDDLSAAVIGRRIGRKQNQHVDLETDRIAANLHVAFLKDIEQTDLYRLVEFGQFVDGENPPMHPGDQSEMEGFLGRQAHSPGQLGRVDLADHVGEFGAGGKAFCVTLLARPPGDWNLLLRLLGHQRAQRDDLFGHARRLCPRP